MSGGREGAWYLAEIGGVEGSPSLVLDYFCSFKRNCYLAETGGRD